MSQAIPQSSACAFRSPLRFEPDVHKALWGEENWLVSAHATAPGRLIGGGTLLDVRRDFPLLVKTIRARESLSVQVHPNERTAKTVGGEPKSEMWCVLEAGPLFAGFLPGVTAEDVARAVADGSFERLLVRFDAKPGECYFIPGGLVHALGGGISVYEVQQSSTTTFRLYDWNRLGADGRPRPLHVQEALRAMDLSLSPPHPSATVDCAFFSFATNTSGYLSPADVWRIVFTPSTGDSFLLPPGIAAQFEAPSFVTIVK